MSEATLKPFFVSKQKSQANEKGAPVGTAVFRCAALLQ